MSSGGEKKFTKADVHRVYFVRTLLAYVESTTEFRP